jgi:uncharacterized protein
MIIEGGFKAKAPIDKLFDFFMEPGELMTCVPGMESVNVIDANTFETVMKQRVGIISVKMKLKMKYTKTERPNVIEAEGEGEDVTKLGHVKMKIVAGLTEAGGEVDVSYKVDVSMVGKLAMFGDRVMKSKAKDVEKEFTKNLQGKLSALA